MKNIETVHEYKENLISDFIKRKVPNLFYFTIVTKSKRGFIVGVLGTKERSEWLEKFEEVLKKK